MQYNLEPVPEGLKIYVLRNVGGVDSALGHSHGTATIRGTFGNAWGAARRPAYATRSSLRWLRRTRPTSNSWRGRRPLSWAPIPPRNAAAPLREAAPLLRGAAHLAGEMLQGSSGSGGSPAHRPARHGLQTEPCPVPSGNRRQEIQQQQTENQCQRHWGS